MKQKLLLLLFILFSFYTAYAQDPHYTQRLVNPMFSQPALTGIQGQPAVGAQYRDQWSKGYKTGTLFYSQHLDLLHGGVGVQVMNDRGGYYNTLIRNAVHLTYAPEFKLSDEMDFRAGLQLGYEHQLQSSVHDSIYPASISYPDVSIGFAVLSKRIYGSVSAFHLTGSQVPFSGGVVGSLQRRIALMAGSFIPLQEAKQGWLLAPFAAHYTYFANFPSNMYLIGCGVSKGIVTGGVSHRGSFGINSGIINFMIGANIGRAKIGYSYDLDELGSLYGHSHELSLTVYLGKEKDTHPTQAHYFRRML